MIFSINHDIISSTKQTVNLVSFQQQVDSRWTGRAVETLVDNSGTARWLWIEIIIFSFHNGQRGVGHGCMWTILPNVTKLLSHSGKHILKSLRLYIIN